MRIFRIVLACFVSLFVSRSPMVLGRKNAPNFVPTRPHFLSPVIFAPKKAKKESALVEKCRFLRVLVEY